jgi:hypothetical protein
LASNIAATGHPAHANLFDRLFRADTEFLVTLKMLPSCGIAQQARVVKTVMVHALCGAPVAANTLTSDKDFRDAMVRLEKP